MPPGGQGMTFFSTYQSTDLPLLSTLYEPPPKHLISVLVLGVLPAYQKTGAAGVLFFETATRAKRLGYRYGEASWILEDNVMMNRAAEAMRGHKYKTHRIYQKAKEGLT